MNRHVRLLATLLGASLVGAQSARAQRLIDWPLRTSAGAEALVPGAAAAFWNPAAAGALDGRGEALLMDIEGPDAAGVHGLAAAGAVRHGRMALALGYAHLGIDGIPRTSTSPFPDASDPELDVGEDLLSLGVARAFGESLWAGAAVRYWRANRDGGAGTGQSVGMGVLYHSALPLAPALGVSVLTGDDGPRWSLGVEAAGAPLRARPWQLGVSYGLSTGRDGQGAGHRVAGTVSWRERVALEGGMAAEPESDVRDWQPTLAARVRFGRYELGVLRESLSGLQAAYYYRLKVRF